MKINKRFALALLLTVPFLSSIVYSKETYGPYKATVVRVLDGDTVEVKINLWPGLSKTTKLRVSGIDTPEKRGSSACEKKAALKATQYTKDWLKGQEYILVKDIHLGKWAGRALGRIEKVDGSNLGLDLIMNGHARSYNGGKRRSWCK